MSFLLRKIIDTWNATKEPSSMVTHHAPVCPPTPDLSHLTPDEIRAIHKVIVRQEEFERQEEGRVRRLRDELDSLQQQLHRKSEVDTQDRKSVDVQLCQLCFKTKFNEGAGRICSDCQQRVCQQCGGFSRSRGSIRRTKTESQWRCKLCMAHRDVLCRTGGWYHGTPYESAPELKKKLSASSSQDGETELKDNTGRSPKTMDADHCPSGNHTEPDLLRKTSSSQNTRLPPPADHSRRRSVVPVKQDLDKKNDGQTEGDKCSLKKLMLERQLSRRRRQEKLQRQRLKTGVKKPQIFDECRGDSADYSDTNSSTFSSFSDSGRSSPTPTVLKVTSQGVVTNKGISALSKHSKLDPESKGHIFSSDRKRKISRESQRSQSVTSDQVAMTQPSKSPDKQPLRESGEKSLQKWQQSGFPNAYLLLLQCRPKGCPFGLKVTGGVQDDPTDIKTLVLWVSSEIKASISEGHEVLEWNGKVLKGQTYDYVCSITSQDCPCALLLVNPTKEREENKLLCVGGSLNSQDDPQKQQSDLQTGKSRILPRIPTDTQQSNSQVKGELQIKILYQPEKAMLTITIVKARHFADIFESEGCRTFVMVNLVPGSGRTCLETELQVSLSSSEWNQTFDLSGISLTELTVKALQLTVWNRDEEYDHFKGEVLLDLSETQLDNKAYWYNLEEHDDNSPPLPRHRRSRLVTDSANWTSHSYKDSPIMCPTVSPEVPIKRNSSPSTGSSNVSPVPFGSSQIVSTDFHINSVSQTDSFTDKVKKKMKKTVSKMSPLTFMERKDNAGSDDSMGSESLRRFSSRGGPVTKNPSLQKSSYIFNQNLDLLAPPRPLSRASSCSSILMSDDEEEPGQCSLPAVTSDRPPPDGDDITSTLGPGQIPPKPSAETTVCGDIRLGFMVTKGQLEVDIICAASLTWDRQIQPPDTFVKTYLVEGKKVIQSKKTNIVKTSADPSYHKKIKYSASNVHGRIMKIVVWKRVNTADKKICLGEALVRLDVLDLSTSTVAWYKLFKMNSTEYGSEEFLSSW